MLDEVQDIDLLYATLDQLHAAPPTSEDERLRLAMLHLGMVNRLDALERLEQAHRDVIDLVVEMRSTKGPSIDAADETALRALLRPLPRQSIRKLEKELVLWPKFGAQHKMNQIIGIVTSFERGTDAEESRRGHFPEAEGAAVEARLSDRTKDFGVNQCLNFLHNASLDELFGDEQAEVAEASSEYARGAKERGKTTITHAKTLSRLASELRLKGLVGPVNILQWRGRGTSGHHDPAAGDLFVRLSGAGPGWYFFLCSQISFHTFVIAVQVSGSGRRFFEIQGGQSLQLTEKEVSDRFDTRFDNPEGASSRVWQIYLTPAR